MKLSMTRVLTPLAALAFAFSAQAELPANEGFEGAAMDANWTFAPGTDGAADASVITAYGSDAKPADTLVGAEKPGLPDGFATDGDKYLKLSTEDGTLFRNVFGGATNSVGAGLYLDTVVQFTVTDKGDQPTPTADDKFIIWLEVDSVNNTTNLCVYGGEYSLTENVIGLNGRKVYTLSGDFEAIQPGSWHRLTVKAVADMGLKLSSGSSYSMGTVPAFQVYIDGKLCVADDILFNDSNLVNDCEDADLVNDMEFVPAMVAGGQLSQIGFSGEGKLDDVVITTQTPSVEPHDTVTIQWSSDKVASITPKANGAELGTFTTSPAVINVPAGATVTLATEDIAAATGYTADYFEFGASTAATGDGELTVESDNKSLSLEFSEAGEASTLTLDIAYTLAYTVTVDWEDIYNDYSADLVSVTIGDTVISGAGLSELSYDVEGVAPGASFTVSVAYKSGSTLETVYTLDANPAGGLERDGTTITVPASYQQSGEVTLRVSLSAEAPAPKLFQVGSTQYTMAELVEAMTAGTLTTSQAEPLTLLDNVTFEDGITVPADYTLWLDLAGNTITGPADGALATVAGTLNVVDSATGGAAVAGTDGSIASVATTGTLNLTAGDYTGAITANGDGVIYITGGTFDADVTGATFPVGYGLEYDDDNECYAFAAKTYTIVYNANGGSGSDPADTTFTIEAAGVIIANPYTAPANKTFNGWNTLANGEGTAYAAGAATPEVTAGLAASTTLYAQWADAGKAIEPGQQDPTEYTSEADAKAAAANIEVKAAKEVEDELTGEGVLAAYLAKFEVKSVEKSEGVWVNEVALTSAAATALQTEANADAVAAAAKVADAATEAQTVTITTTPGFYYSVKSGTTLGGMTEGARTLATGASMDVTLPKGDTAGFYSILVNTTK